MNEINRFQELLAKTLEIAKDQNNRIEGQKIKEIFADMELNDAQFDQINMYLITNKIEVLGFIKPEELNLDKMNSEEQLSAKDQEYVPKEINKRDSAYLKDYLEELEGIKEASEEEINYLLQRIKQGDSAAKQRFIEINLHKVVEIAGEFKNQGMTAEDLIQEGNMALLQLVNALPSSNNVEQVRQYVHEYIHNYLAEMILEQQNSDMLENTVMQKMNRIYNSLKELEEQLGRKASVSELANYMKVTEDDIHDVLELAADILALEEGEYFHGHDHHCHEHHSGHECNCHADDHYEV